MSILVLLAPSLTLARKIAPPTLTVEAEYGAEVVEGTLYTAAHHQPTGSPFAGRHVVDGGRPSPCNDRDITHLGNGDVILISHIDLDTVGGVLRAFPEYADLFTEANQTFWDMAEFVDVNGAHRAHLFEGLTDEVARQMYAWYAYSKGMPRTSRDEVADVSNTIRDAGDALRRIFAGDAALLAAGNEFRQAETNLNARTYDRRAEKGVILRVARNERDFCNHLYAAPDGVVGRAIVVYNTVTGAITISLAEPDERANCREIVQALWGGEAGGHKGIAGSPRGQRMATNEFDRAVAALIAALT